MESTSPSGKLSSVMRPPLRYSVAILAMALALGLEPTTSASHAPRTEQVRLQAIPAQEFSRIVEEFSEDGGVFRSDNFVSNETSYLHVVDKLHDLGCAGGAYIGVGPEQNFTYIAKIRPRIAFIIDVRRQAIIQHLLYKAIFHLANTRAEFLSYLFSMPIEAGEALGAEAPIEKIVSYFSGATSNADFFRRNLATIRKTIHNDFFIHLSDSDLASLEYIYTAFRDQNLNIQYRLGGTNWGGTYWGGFPTLGALILGKDLRGNLGNFLASSADYDFVRNLHEQNRIIPVVGDFAGSKALAAIAEYLKKNNYCVTAFYTSNVEQYLFTNGVFNLFADNVRKLPLTDRSLFIRSFPNSREPHPASASGHRLTTLLENMQVFLNDYDQGVYQDYWTLVTTHFIAGGPR